MKLIEANCEVLHRMRDSNWGEIQEIVESDLVKQVIQKLMEDECFYEKPITFIYSQNIKEERFLEDEVVITVQAKVDDDYVVPEKYEYKYEYPKGEDLENPRHPFWY